MKQRSISSEERRAGSCAEQCVVVCCALVMGFSREQGELTYFAHQQISGRNGRISILVWVHCNGADTFESEAEISERVA